MTVEQLCGVVGAATGIKWETTDAFSKLVMGRSRATRISLARSIVYMVLQDVLSVSYNEIAILFDRDPSVVHRSLVGARRWRDTNPGEWRVIKEEVERLRREEGIGTAAARG